MLILLIKKKWFDMIKSGEKKEEYREIKPYYTTRFDNILYQYFKDENGNILCNHVDYFDVIFRNGYRKDSPEIKCKVHISKGYGNPEWGAEPNKLYYVLEILSVEEVC